MTAVNVILKKKKENFLEVLTEVFLQETVLYRESITSCALDTPFQSGTAGPIESSTRRKIELVFT
jgi:hypothetical protein